MVYRRVYTISPFVSRGFAANYAVVYRVGLDDNARLRIVYGEDRTEVDQNDWYKIEWFSDEEKAAVLSVMDAMLNSPWGTRPSIGAGAAILHRTGGGGLSEEISILYPDVEPRIPRDEWAPPDAFNDMTYIVDLGYGYHLFIHTSRGPGGMGMAFGTMANEVFDLIGRVIHISIMIVIAIILFFLYREWRCIIRAKKVIRNKRISKKP